MAEEHKIKLTGEELQRIGPLFGKKVKVKRRILEFISTGGKKGRYFNKICGELGGSKSTINKYLTELEFSEILTTKAGFKTDSKRTAVKYYLINEKYRALLMDAGLI